MKFTQNLHVVGMKASKGTLENGNAYDSTKVYCLIDLDASKGTAKGMSAAEFTFGTADEFDAFKHLPFPFQADADMEMVTNGKTMKTVMHKLTPKAVATGKGQ
ncbi:hypothetical protein [Acidovorax sp. SUPP3334]|uniref:hypothetical protein n=1 Tax=Acidovorax sp. SUPP3334 TaxID=2920881 RepID=UPI0023DE2DE6|nr:hypothetical protein [Acidovorax sp. SUPP3334]GKT22769.1 hypothetical protein AVHM3334_09485 [Acidovorax sp. SUPP3334]